MCSGWILVKLIKNTWKLFLLLKVILQTTDHLAWFIYFDLIMHNTQIVYLTSDLNNYA